MTEKEMSMYYDSYEDTVFVDVETVRYLLKMVANDSTKLQYTLQQMDRVDAQFAEKRSVK